MGVFRCSNSKKSVSFDRSLCSRRRLCLGLSCRMMRSRQAPWDLGMGCGNRCFGLAAPFVDNEELGKGSRRALRVPFSRWPSEGVSG